MNVLYMYDICTGKSVLYDIQHNRWCENVGRAHKSNNIMYAKVMEKL